MNFEAERSAGFCESWRSRGLIRATSTAARFELQHQLDQTDGELFPPEG